MPRVKASYSYNLENLGLIATVAISEKANSSLNVHQYVFPLQDNNGGNKIFTSLSST